MASHYVFGCCLACYHGTIHGHEFGSLGSSREQLDSCKGKLDKTCHGRGIWDKYRGDVSYWQCKPKQGRPGNEAKYILSLTF